MKKTLVIIVHPDLKTSVVNRRWLEELQKHPERFNIHDLYEHYGTSAINVPKEQSLLEAHDKIIFQFPLYWFNCPPLLKQWLDEVLTYGWAYGSKSGYRLSGKKIALAISAGIDEQAYQSRGRYKYTLKELTAPFELTFDYVSANYTGLFAFYGIEHHATALRIEDSVRQYCSFALSF